MTPPLSTVEILESRIAPASLLNAHTIQYTDVDGDDVKIIFSKDVFTGSNDAAKLALANLVFKFDTGTVAHETASTQQLQSIDFTKFPVIANAGSTVNGIGMTITATQKGTGDGHADVGAIKAVGVSLGKIGIEGDLGQIEAGGSGLKIGVAALTVESLGKRGLATQTPVPNPTADNPAPDLVSNITGELTLLKVNGDIDTARVRVIDGKNSQQQITTLAKLGRVTVLGSLLGRAAVETASDDTGTIECDRDIGAVVIGTDATEGIIGGGGANAGRLFAGGKIASIKISGNLAGGGGANSGTISTNNSVGAMTIGGDIAGNTGAGSGAIHIYGNVTSLTVGDDMVAGTGPGSAFVSAIGAINAVLVKGDLDGTLPNSGPGGAGIFANGLPKVTVNGGLLGGAGGQTASIESGRALGVVTIGGHVSGGAGNGSGTVLADGALTSVLIKGNLTGAAGIQSGAVRSGVDTAQAGGMGTVTVIGKVTGGAGDNSGAILSGGALKAVTIATMKTASGDSLSGSDGAFSGSISARGLLGSVKIFGQVQGGLGPRSGSIFSTERMDEDGEFSGDIGTVTISGHLAGGAGDQSGTVIADGGLSALTVGGLLGGTGPNSGGARTGDGMLGTGNAKSIRILGDLAQAAATPGLGSAALFIGGNLTTLSVSGDTSGATIRVGAAAGTLTFMGDLQGSTISALGQVVQGKTTDLTLAKLDVRGQVAGTSIFAGYDRSGAAANPDAQIGTVTVKGNWTASNLVAGATGGGDPGFGNPLDAKAPGVDNLGIVSKIASVVIGGSVSGSGVPGENFGFVAQLVAKVKVGTTIYALNTKADGQSFAVANGVGIQEVGL